MISKKLKTIFLISILILIAHCLEEYLTGFYDIDTFHNIFQYFEPMSVSQATFLIFIIMASLLLVISYLIVSGGKWPLRLLTILGLLFIFELHHLIEVVMIRKYNPGLLTAILFPIVGFLFWKELFRELAAKDS